MNSPIELPTKRHSFQNPRPSKDVDIHDPQWIPILDPVEATEEASMCMEKELSPYSTSSFPPFASGASIPAQNSSLSHAHPHVRSSLAPESVPEETRAARQEDRTPPLPPLPPSPAKFELPAARPTSEYFQLKRQMPPKEEGQETTESEGTAESSADRSTIGTASLLDEQTYSLPPAQTVKDDASELPPLPLSAAPSVSSLRKSAIAPPTSRYSRKPVPSHSANPPSASPRISSVVPLVSSSTQASQPIHSPKPSAVLAQSPLANGLRPSASTASQRRQRALHSHPSNPSLASRRNSSEEDGEPEPVPMPVEKPASRHGSQRSRKSNDARMHVPRKLSFASQLPLPTPAPTTPLPQLPPHALTTDDGSVEEVVKPPPEAHLSQEMRPKLEIDHSAMADFMTSSQTVIFRRFDEVHVQLLLCLQDEISQLERKLSDLDGANMTRNDRTVERMRVIRELRRVVGEYDHLFASWSSMQATKASKSTVQNLRQWLEKPTTSAGAVLGKGAREDLLWLDGSRDLSSVSLGPSPGKAHPSSLEGGRAGRGGFFGGCIGRRK